MVIRFTPVAFDDGIMLPLPGGVWEEVAVGASEDEFEVLPVLSRKLLLLLLRCPDPQGLDG